MNKPHPHSDIIERKLEQLPVANKDSLWNDMHSILDKKMPQKKERRRFIAWFLISKPFLLLTAGFIIGTASTVFFLSNKKNSADTITRLPNTPNKINEDDPAKISQENKGNITTVHEPNQKAGNEISTTTASVNAVDRVFNNSFIKQQIEKQSENFTSTDAFSQPILEIYKARPNRDIVAVNMNSGNFPTTLNRITEKNSLRLQLELTLVNTKAKPGNNHDDGFYTGIISGIDLSSVHFRSAKAGSTKGFIIGYALNKKWSIESGLLWDTKSVSDNGDHFHPPGYTPSSGITIIAVNGKSRLYELPINIKYTILPGRHRLFATAGLSSYLMRSENYDYEYLQNNQPGGHNYLSYKNETKNWFSVVNFSMGYSQRLGNLGNLRLEPYLKLPIKNLGVGKMPIMSTGLNIGFTKTVR